MMVDAYDLSRFVEAQESIYPAALSELKAGQKRTHWMWFIFPQVAGLGYSHMARRYAIASKEEALAYLTHPILGTRLKTCVDMLLAANGQSIEEIMADPDFMKLQSSMTLFAALSTDDSRYEKVLEKYYNGRKDPKTLDFLRAQLNG